MPHISRRELKTDEFHDTLEHGLEILSEHKNAIWQLALILLIVAGGFFAWRYYSGRQDSKAWSAYSQAVAIFNAPVQGNGPIPPGEISYPSDAVKYADAQQALGSVAMRYPRTRYGQMARYYAAVSLEQVGRYQDAINWLLPMSRRGDARFQALARFELARLYDDSGRPAQAVDLYQQLLDNPSAFVPRAIVLLALGDHFRARKLAAQAARYYQQIRSEFPNTGLADQASQRLEMLGKT